MGDKPISDVRDVSVVGVGLAFPGGLRQHMRAMVGEWAPVDRAARLGWSGLEALRLVTAERNGSVAAGRTVQQRSGPIGVEAYSRYSGDQPLVSDVREFVAEAAPKTGAASTRTGAFPALGRTSGTGPAEAASFPVVERVSDLAAYLDRASAAPVPGDGTDRAWLIDQAGGERETVSVVVAPGAALVRRGGTVGPGEAGTAVATFGSMGRGVASAPVRQGGSRYGANVGLALQRVDDDDARAEGRSAEGSTRELIEAPGRQAFVSSPTVRPAAPPMGRGDAGSVSGVGFGEAMAPPPSNRGADGHSGQTLGTINLDGRLVGYWLSEHMAREASRPGAGTTAFDARQAPAWTPSGAL